MDNIDLYPDLHDTKKKNEGMNIIVEPKSKNLIKINDARFRPPFNFPFMWKNESDRDTLLFPSCSWTDRSFSAVR